MEEGKKSKEKQKKRKLRKRTETDKFRVNYLSLIRSSLIATFVMFKLEASVT